MRKLKFFSFFFFLFFIYVIAFVLADSGGDLTIVDPSRWYYPQSTNITLLFDVLDYDYIKLTDDNASCQCDVTNIIGEEILSNNLSYDSGREYWIIELNETHTAEIGEYNTYVYCSANINNETQNGFTSFLFEITESGIDPVDPTVIFDMKGTFILGLIILAFLLLIVGVAAENDVFKISSAIVFVIDGLVLITTEFSGVDTKFTVGIGIILIVIGAFVAIATYKTD